VTVIEVVQEDIGADERGVRALANLLTNLGAPPFTFFMSALVVASAVTFGFSTPFSMADLAFVSSSEVFEGGEQVVERLLTKTNRLEVDFDPYHIAYVIGFVGGFVPLLCILALRAIGVIKSLDLNTARERTIGFLFACGGAVCLLPVLASVEAPPLFSVFVLAHVVTTALMFALTLFTMRNGWKASVHSGGVGCLFFVSLQFLPWPLWLSSFILLWLISWTRLYLNRHTWGQVVLGGAWGFFCYAVIFAMCGITPAL
jgi:hypothetical protein